MLPITAQVRDASVAHAIGALPNEACAMLAAHASSDVIVGFWPIDNAAGSPTRFSLDPQQMLDAEAAIDAAGLRWVAVLHSHPAAAPYPSATDIADSASYDPDGSMVQVIVSLAHADPSMRAFTIVDGAVEELPVVVVDDPDPDDAGGDEPAEPIAAVARLPLPGVE